MEAVKFLSGELKIYRLISTDSITIPIYPQTVPGGFPSPAMDYMEEEINFNAYLKPKPLSTLPELLLIP